MRTNSCGAYTCDKCGKYFNIHCKLKRHLDEVHAEDPLAAREARMSICEICSKMVRKKAMPAHVRVMHSKEMPFE